MSNMDIMYRAYRELQNAMAEATTYSEMTEALAQADDGNDMHGGTVALREIDMDWVETIEDAIPYIDAAIRDQRRFIVQEDEIVPIEKSRKITSESVRHLAQHTNMIAQVENDEVTPEKILNIYREESYEIYENRFLYTLLESVSRFVETRYEALRRIPNDSVAQLQMNRIVRVRQEQVRVQLAYETEYSEEDDVDIFADVSELSKFQRVLRVRKIISNFMATPLMRSLAGCEPVRPPIMRTNLLTKNTNFRAALSLWIFLESYTKNGYYTVLSKADGPMDLMMKQSLYDVISLTRFVVRMNLSEGIRKSLEEEYEAENIRRAEEAQRIEEERRQAEERRLELALTEQAQEYEKQIAELIADYESRIEIMNEIFQKQTEEMTASYEAQLASQKLEYETQLSNQESMYEGRILKMTTEYETQLSNMKTGYEEQILALTTDYETRLADRKSEYERTIQNLTADYETQLGSQKAEYEEQIQTLVSDYRTQLGNQKEGYEGTIRTLTDDYETQLSEQKHTYEAEIYGLNAQIETERQTMQETLANQMEEFSRKQEQEFGELAERYAAEAEEERSLHETQMEELRNAHAMEISALSASYDAKIADQAVRHSKEMQNLNQKTRKDREANALVKREMKSLESECKALKQNTERMERRMKKVEEQASRRISRADLWNEFRVRRLKSKLEKAIARYPLEEVRKAGENLWDITADPVFDAEEAGAGRFEYFRFDEISTEAEEQLPENTSEESTI